MSDAMHHKSLQPGYRRALLDKKRAKLRQRRMRDRDRKQMSPGVRVARWMVTHEGIDLAFAQQVKIARKINAILAAKARQERSYGRALGWNAAKGVTP
ncbi:MAG: hypothetical protein ACK4WH_13085 [Phycisphaerales bacterium]